MMATLLGLAAAQPAIAAPDLKQFNGVWQGTIGTLPVQACYDGGEYSSDGKYFYSKRLKTIPLIADDKKPGDLTEGWADSKGVARWRMTSIGKHQAAGAWSGNGKTLPIRLTRVAFVVDEDFDRRCSSLAFVQPILDATRIVKSAARIKGLPAERWALAAPDGSISVTSFQLLGSGPALAAINRRLREPFDKSEEGWKWCLRNARSFGAHYQDSTETKLVTNRWLSVNAHNDSFCGGAHPNTSNQAILFDRRTGAVVNLYDWLAAGNVHREKVEGYEETLDTLKNPLRAAVIKRHPRNAGGDECRETIQATDSWLLELKATGIAFTPDLPRVVMACGDAVELPWAALAPFLNPAGKREVAALRAELRR